MIDVTSWLGALRFAGGLSETDWFTFGTGAVGTSFGWWAYNQNAYCNQVSWRQSQMYQHKNYQLSWVGIARDDIRELMSVSVNRISNYMLIATLILGIAAESLFWVNNFDPRCPGFVINFFWLSIGLSVMFLSLAILFGIKGQNSAFVNTMRLLTWEVRPENPSSYNHDYLRQVQRWEWGGLASLFRVPGRLVGARGPGSNGNRRTDAGETTEQAASGDSQLEEIKPETDELIYLARFAHFMRLWVPYEAYSRFCIGLGFISLSQGAAYFALGAMTLHQEGLYRHTAIFGMLSVFTFMTGIIFHQNYKAHYAVVQFAAVGLFMSGPILAFLAIYIKEPHWLPKALSPAASFIHSVNYAIILLVVSYGKKSIPKDITNSYISGPHGQGFTHRGIDGEPVAKTSAPTEGQQKPPTESAAGLSPEDSLLDLVDKHLQEESQSTSSDANKAWHHGLSTDPDAPTLEEERLEDMEAIQVLERVVGTVQSANILAALLWLLIAIVTTLDIFHLVGPSHVPEATVHEVPVSWPDSNMRADSMACSAGEIFISTRFDIFRISHTGKPQREPCSRDGPIADIASTCDRRGRHCWPLALMQSPKKDAEAISSTQLVDCSSHEAIPLLQQPSPSQRVALRSVGGVSGKNDGVLMAMHEGSVVRYRWSTEDHGWVPEWERAADIELDIKSLDLVGSTLLEFGVLPQEGQNISVVQAYNLKTGQPAGMWRLPDIYAPIVAGCSLHGHSLLAVTDETPPRLLQIDIPDLPEED